MKFVLYDITDQGLRRIRQILEADGMNVQGEYVVLVQHSRDSILGNRPMFILKLADGQYIERITE